MFRLRKKHPHTATILRSHISQLDLRKEEEREKKKKSIPILLSLVFNPNSISHQRFSHTLTYLLGFVEPSCV